MYINDRRTSLWVDVTNPGAARSLALYLRWSKRADMLSDVLWYAIGTLAVVGIGLTVWLWYVRTPKAAAVELVAAAIAIVAYLLACHKSTIATAEQMRILRACRVNGVVMDCGSTTYRYLVQALQEVHFTPDLDAYPQQVTLVFVRYALMCRRAEMALSTPNTDSQAEAMEVWDNAQQTARYVYGMFNRQ